MEKAFIQGCLKHYNYDYLDIGREFDDRSLYTDRHIQEMEHEYLAHFCLKFMRGQKDTLSFGCFF